MHPIYAPYGVYHDTASEWFEMTENAKKVRLYLEDFFIEHGRSPNLPRIMRDNGLDQNQTWHALWQLERAVQVMFVPGSEDIVKVPPFSNAATRHRVTVDGESKWFAGCAGESCAVNAMFPGKTVTVDSHCPCCWEPIRFSAKDRQLVDFEPKTAVLHIGVSPHNFRKDWIVTCDSINFFIDADHVAVWEKAWPQKRGVYMPAPNGIAWVDRVASTRHYDYNRGPDVANGDMIRQAFADSGLDVSVWD